VASGAVGGPGAQLIWSVASLVRGVTRSRSLARASRLLFFSLRYLDSVIPRAEQITAPPGPTSSAGGSRTAGASRRGVRSRSTPERSDRPADTHRRAARATAAVLVVRAYALSVEDVGGQGMSTSSIRSRTRSDIGRYTLMRAAEKQPADRRATVASGVKAVVAFPGLQAQLCHRLGESIRGWAPRGAPARAVRTCARVAHWCLTRAVETTTGISINPGADIGPGLYIGHFGGIIVGEVTLGSNCNLSQGVTLGRTGRIGEHGAPVLGDRVWVGPGAVVVGPVAIGDDALIGANTVVTKDVPARALAIGSPMRVFPDVGSFDYVLYPRMDEDDARRTSLAERDTPP